MGVVAPEEPPWVSEATGAACVLRFRHAVQECETEKVHVCETPEDSQGVGAREAHVQEKEKEMTDEETIAKLRLQLATCNVVRKRAIELKDEWKEMARVLRAQLDALKPGHDWGPKVERWRSLVAAYFQPGDVDLALGIIRYESGGNHLAVCKVEWIGNEPPGYDGTDATRASGLFQHVPAYWAGRSASAGYGGSNIFDVEANVAVAAWLVYHGWNPATAPHWKHWSGAHVNVLGSYEKACRDLGIEP